MARKQAAYSGASLPYDQFAESQAVGTALLDPSKLEGCGLCAEHFYDSRCCTAFRAIMGAVHAGTPLDDNIICQKSGFSYTELQALRTAVVDVTRLPIHAAKIIEMSVRRRLIGQCSLTSGEASTNFNKPADEILMEAMSKLDGLRSAGEAGIIVFVRTVVSMSSTPRYKVTLRVKGEEKELVLVADELMNRPLFKKKVIERFHDNPIMPEKAEWDDFMRRILNGAKREVAPEEASEEATLAFYIREWLKVAVEADSPIELIRGYVERNGFIYFLPERMRLWI
ncbi:MAG: hypothetical protein M0R22_10710, partial [Dehalococcoidia bacterium]|nr:hypothetical protein [Dehalococcoidia bacterium]